MNAQSIIPPNIDYGKISADKYSPDDTYEAGELRIQYNSLWKSNQKIPVPEPWTPAHWDPTTLAAELSAVNSRMNTTGWFAINFSTIKRNGSYVAVIDFPKAYDLIDNISVIDCVGYNNYSSIDLECNATISEYSKNSIIINCGSESALGISANISLNITYKTDL